MTDRVKGFIVTFTQDIREDDVVLLASAIALLQGVASVTNITADPSSDYVVQNRTILRATQDVRKLLLKWATKGPGEVDE